MAQTASGESQARDSFTSRTAFIIACIGSAVGLSGIWLFPYRVSQLGGAAFLIPYLFFVVLLGLTGVVGEMSFGRAMGCGPMGAFGKALELRGVPHATRIGKAIGIVPVLAALGISRDRALGELRFSLGPATTETDVDAAVAALSAAVNR